MKGLSTLSLAIALALAGSNAFALGLGPIHLNSKLDQKLDAQIPVVTDNPDQAAGLTVQLASAEDFERVGLNRMHVSVPLEFSVGTDSHGQPVINVTTKDIVREPFIDFLIEVDWPKGKLLREYTVLLDPPVMAPALKGSTASVSPAHEAAPTHAQKLATTKPKPKPHAAHVKPPRSAAAKPHAKPAPAKAAPKHVAHAAAPGEYGPVAKGETLSEIVRATRPDEKTNLDKMMLAMLKANPSAFFQDNINALKRGAILRIPSADEIRASGSAMQVAAAVREQNEAWAANAPVARPTLVAKTGAPKPGRTPHHAAHTTSGSASGAHLALVPPHAGKNKGATADRPGAANGSGNSAVRAELARTKETLASRDQEVGDLKSRVQELEDLHGKDQRLLTLKQSELAQLQEKLKQLQAQANAKPAPAVTTPAEATKPAAAASPTAIASKPAETVAGTGKPLPKLTAKDIWGSIGGENPPKTTPETSEPGAKPGTSVSTAPATPPTEPGAKPATAPGTTPAAPPPTTSTTAAKTPAKTAPLKPKPASHPEPIKPPATPWYQNDNVLLGGGAALVIIGLLALMRFMRKPKLQPRPEKAPAGEAVIPGGAADEEQHLLDQLAQHPGDPQLSLELLSLYYANGDRDKFETTAEAMYAHIGDPNEEEWQQVRAMGAELCPHNPLFADAVDHGHGGEEHADHFGAGPGEPESGEEHDFGFGGGHDAGGEEEGFDFDLTDHTAEQATHAHAAPETAAPSHDLDLSEAHADAHAETHVPEHDLPMPELEPPAPAPVPAAPTPVAAAPAPAADFATQTMKAVPPSDEFFAGEDTIGTKLDLAKAYLDMGDPEGARSMLDEVMNEGNDAQKDEARKLLAEIQ